MRSVFITVWVLVVSSGFALLLTYAARPGGVGPDAPAWPRNVSISPAADHYNLVLSIHPKCPCSNATAEELATILAHTRSAMQVHVLVYTPADALSAWSRTSLVEAIERLPNVALTLDPDGAQAARFGALTSGDAQLFSPAGTLLFHGGITPSRGHMGDNAGSDAIKELVLGRSSTTHATPVFGCSLNHARNDNE